MHASYKLFLASIAVFAAALALRRAFFWEVMPIGWNVDPPYSWSLETAFLLLSIQNVAAIVAAIVFCLGAAFLIRRRRRAIAADR